MTTFILLFSFLSLILLYILFPYLVCTFHISSAISFLGFFSSVPSFFSLFRLSSGYALKNDLHYQSYYSWHCIHLQYHFSIKTAYLEKIPVLLKWYVQISALWPLTQSFSYFLFLFYLHGTVGTAILKAVSVDVKKYHRWNEELIHNAVALLYCQSSCKIIKGQEL